MPQIEFSIKSFKGISQKESQVTVDSNIIVDSNNVHTSKINGVVSKISGYSKIRTNQTAIAGTQMDLYSAKLVVNSDNLLAFTTTNIYKLTTTDFTSIKSGLTGSQSNLYSYDIAIDDTSSPPDELVIITNSVDNIQKWDVAASPTATADLGGSPPKAREIIFWNRRVFLGYTIESGNEFPNRISWSGIGDPEDWSSALSGFRDLNLNDGEFIVRLVQFRNFLVILSSQSITMLSYVAGSDVFLEKRITTRFGCVAPRSIYIINDILIYMSDSGLVAFNGSEFQLITFDKWNMTDVNFDKLRRCNVGRLKELGQLYFCFPSSGSSNNDKTLIFDYRKGEISFSDFSFSGFDEHDLDSDLTWEDASWSWQSEQRTWSEIGFIAGEPVLVGLDYSGFVDRLNVGANKNGSQISSFFETGWLSFGSSWKRKKLTGIRVNATKTPINLTLRLFTDNIDETSQNDLEWKDATTKWEDEDRPWEAMNNSAVKTFVVSLDNSSGNFVSSEIDLILDFRVLKIKIENNSNDEIYDIHSIDFIYEFTKAIS